jgi:hypothetical protein
LVVQAVGHDVRKTEMAVAVGFSAAAYHSGMELVKGQ